MQRGTTIWQYLQHWNEHPWFDTGNYEWWQIALFLTGAVLWIVVYVDTIYNIIKFQSVNIPLIAICLNFGFEVTTSFVFVPDMGKTLVIAYWAWMVLDVFIVYNMFKYGWKQIRLEQLKPHEEQLECRDARCLLCGIGRHGPHCCPRRRQAHGAVRPTTYEGPACAGPSRELLVRRRAPTSCRPYRPCRACHRHRRRPCRASRR